MLIGNDIHYKAIKQNISRGVFPYVTLIYGEYGTGKTHLAKEITRFLLCPEWCGKCDICKGIIGESTFSAKASLTNMAKVDPNKAKLLLRENVEAFTMDTRVFIYDEFHLLHRTEQELWLAETAKLDNTYLILTSTNLSKIDSGIKSRSLKIKMSSLSLHQSIELMKEKNLFITDELAIAIFNTTRGVPRDILILSTYVKNAGLDNAESLVLINNQSKPPIDMLITLRNNPEDFLKLLHEIDTNFTKDEIISYTRTVLWAEVLNTSDARYKNSLLNAMIQLDKNYLLALVNLVQVNTIQKNVKKILEPAPSVSKETKKEVTPW